jgi:hypothetical protein
MEKKEIFLQAINDKKIVLVKVNSKEKGIIVREGVPFDFGPSRKFNDDLNRYHFYDLNSPEGQHNLSITPDQLMEIEITDKSFEPKDYVKWTPRWFIKRDWGIFS